MKDLFDIERSLWTNDPEIYRSALREDALLLFPETGPITRDVAVAAIHDEVRENRRWAEVGFADQRTLAPADGVRVLIYRAIARWNYAPQPIAALCSSTYALSGGDSKLVFHQQTPVPA